MQLPNGMVLLLPVGVWSLSQHAYGAKLQNSATFAPYSSSPNAVSRIWLQSTNGSVKLTSVCMRTSTDNSCVPLAKRYGAPALVALNILALLWLGRTMLLSAQPQGAAAASEVPQQLSLRSKTWQPPGQQLQNGQQQQPAVREEEWYWGPIDAAPQQPTGYMGGQQHEVCAWLQGGEPPRGGYVVTLAFDAGLAQQAAAAPGP